MGKSAEVDMEITEQGILDFLDQELAIDIEGISLEDPLFSTGVIDSFALVSLMMYLESGTGMRISPTDVNLANFDSVSRILAYVERLSQSADN